MHNTSCLISRLKIYRRLVFWHCFFLAGIAAAQPTILSSLPTTGASGVSASASVIFVFSEPMNPAATFAQFVAPSSPMTPLPTSPSWSGGNTMLTCTPVPPFPADTMIYWNVTGESAGEVALSGNTFGYFTTATSGEDCTNLVNTFTVAKAAAYVQNSAAPPVANTNAPYLFLASARVACSNLNTTNISLTLPTSSITNVPSTAMSGQYLLSALPPTEMALESTYPNGDYIFTLQPSNSIAMPFPVHFPSSLVMPNAPHLTNYTAAQSIDAAQPFLLGWDAFQDGTAADWISVQVYEAFQTPQFGEVGALDGTATSVTIPAGTLQKGQPYRGVITFYDLLVETNTSPGYIRLVYRAATTEFSLSTGAGSPVILTNCAGTNFVFSFDIDAAAGQILTIQSRTNLSLGIWEDWFTTNSPGGLLRVIDPRSVTNKSIFYRVEVMP